MYPTLNAQADPAERPAGVERVHKGKVVLTDCEAKRRIHKPADGIGVGGRTCPSGI
jgi:hypothetical protein